MNNIEKIEDLLAGRLNTEESSQIQSLIDSDPVLKNEANLQQDIIDGIQEKRRLELKSRLNDLPTPGTSFTKYYIAAASFATIILGWIAIDNYTQKPAKIVDLDKSEISRTKDQISSTETVESTKTPLVIAEENITTDNNQDAVSSDEAVEQIVSYNNTNAELAHPDLGSLPDDADAFDSDGNVGDIDNSNNIEKPMGINRISKKISDTRSQSSEKHMRYTYVGNKLHLIGPWSHKYPYELTDIGSDQAITLKFKGKTYKLVEGKKDAPLVPINE